MITGSLYSSIILIAGLIWGALLLVSCCKEVVVVTPPFLACQRIIIDVLRSPFAHQPTKKVHFVGYNMMVVFNKIKGGFDNADEDHVSVGRRNTVRLLESSWSTGQERS